MKNSYLKTLLAAFLLTFSLAAHALTWTDPDTGIKWTYTKLADGTASLGTTTSSAIPKSTTGNLIVPDTIAGLKVTEMKRLSFCGCSKITSIQFEDSIKCVEEGIWFQNCYELYNAEFDKIITTNIKNINFQYCSKLSTLENLANWDVSKVNNLEFAFQNCQALNNLNGLENWDVSNVTDFSSMFYQCIKLSDISALQNWNTSKVTDMSNMFSQCKTLSSLKGLENWDVSNVTNMYEMFSSCTSVTDADVLYKWDVSNVKNMEAMFRDNYKITELTRINSWDTKNVENMAMMFYNCSKLNKVSLDNWNTCKVTTMGNMFNYCQNLATVTGLENWDVSNVKHMTAMFAYCHNLENIDISNWNVSDTVYMSMLFYRCYKITNFQGIDKWDYSGKKITLTNAFYQCKGIKEINLQSFNINEDCETVQLMYGCTGLTRIVLPPQNLQYSAFNGCTALEELTIPSNWEEIPMQFLWGCNSLKEITIPNRIQSIGARVFYGCTNLTNVYCMSTTPPDLDATAFGSSTGTINKTLYVKTSALEAYRNHEQWGRFAVITDQIPVTIAAGKQYATLALDFDADFSQTEGLTPYTAAAYYEGTTAAAKVASAYQQAGMPAKARAAAKDNTIRTVVIAKFPDNYIPSRTGQHSMAHCSTESQERTTTGWERMTMPPDSRKQR